MRLVVAQLSNCNVELERMELNAREPNMKFALTTIQEIRGWAQHRLGASKLCYINRSADFERF